MVSDTRGWIAISVVAWAIIARIIWVECNHEAHKETSCGDKPIETGNSRSSADAISCVFDGHASERQENRETEQLHQITRQANAAWWTFVILLGALVVSGIAAAFAGQAFIEAKRQADAAQGQIDVARDTEIASNRAWLYPENMEITVPSDGNRILIQGDTKNVGHEPALGVIFAIPDMGSVFIDGNVNAKDFNIPRTDMCAGLGTWIDVNKDREQQEPNHNVIFPDQKLDYIRGLDPPPSLSMINDMIDKTYVAYYLRDCVSYWTFHQRHTSAFCVYMTFDPLLHKRVTYRCAYGNDAN